MRAGELRKGNVIEFRDALWRVLDTQVTSVGKKGAYVQVKMQNLSDQHLETQRFSTSDTVQKAFLESRSMTYLYRDADSFVFMDPKTGDQVQLGTGQMEGVFSYLAYNAQVEIRFCKGQPVQVELPPSVVLEVVKTEPAVRGNTATAVTKPAELETGIAVKVPGYVRQGEKVRVDTRTGEFLGRAS